ncbi:septal ring lytic transglycosylase RlpA family protein [Chitinimonas lacunae]|uniref:Endolytic peptidoglycan transglycosylase RlpA n=1 Tax=Chitinimonas lacunae TaxID=1963018 RepID=A0ABV8MQG7_9NEIS
MTASGLRRPPVFVIAGHWSAFTAVLLLAACATQRPAPTTVGSSLPPAKATPSAPSSGPAPAKREQLPKFGGGYYKDDGPLLEVPYDLDALAEPEPRLEPLHRFANRPYSVLGQTFEPMTRLTPYKVRGIGSWYGRKFHGQPTSSGEPYDMFKLTAAHPVLPIPSYVRVTNLENGRSIVLRVNDRGPFLKNRVIDLSYAAAYRLGYHHNGSARVEVESVWPGATPSPVLVNASPTDDPIALLAMQASQASDESAEPEAAPIAPVSAALPMATEGRGGEIWLQLAAFGNASNAEAFKSRLAGELDWLPQRLTVAAGDRVWRVRAGPFSDRDAARRAADRIASAFDLRPLLVR